jgi:hypothetical protein
MIVGRHGSIQLAARPRYHEPAATSAGPAVVVRAAPSIGCPGRPALSSRHADLDASRGVSRLKLESHLECPKAVLRAGRQRTKRFRLGSSGGDCSLIAEIEAA